MLEIPAISLEYVKVPVRARANGEAIDPTGDTVRMAFKSEGATPASGDWKMAAWETDDSVTPSVYYAYVLVGPGGVITLTPGRWLVWVKITDSPEIPTRPASGPLIIT